MTTRRASSSDGTANSMSSRVKKFQICIWIIVAFTFLHLGTRPMVTPPEKLEAKNKTKTTTIILPTATGRENDVSERHDTNALHPSTSNIIDDNKNVPISPLVTPLPTESIQTAPPPSPPSTPPTKKPKSRLEPDSLVDTSSFTINPPQLQPVIGNTFVERHCDLKNLKEGAWYPTGDDQWQQRAPYFIIAGTWNSGVNPLANALLMHPQINAANVHGFFLPRTFNRKFVTRTSKPPSMMLNNVTAADSSVENVNIQVFAARDRMYHAVYSPSSLRDTDSTAGSVNADNDASKRSKSKLVAMDISPGLLFYAHTTSPSVVCVSPWSKIVILLRNPVDRLYQQWVYSKTKLSLSLSLEDWVAREMKAMQSTGLIGDNAAAQESAIISERDAWNNYQSVSSSTGAALGRSMYVLQLHDWILTYLEAGKKPSEEIIIIASEELEENPTKKYAEVIGFLGLAPLNMTAADNSHDFGNAISKPVPPKGIDPMKKETRAMLEQFFRPYNKRLVKLLKEQGFEGEWEKIWK